MELFYSNGWKKPYCYTIFDMHQVVKGPINNKNGIMDGGYYVHKRNLISKEKHIEFLLKSNFKFIMGFDYCPHEERTELVNLMLKHKKNIYPIIQTDKDWKWFLKNKWMNKVEGIATGYTKYVNLAYKNKLKIHYLGRIKDKNDFKKITSLDINPFENTKRHLLNLGSDHILKLNDDILKLGEFILYGSSLFINTPNDYDLLYYGNEDEKVIKELIKKSKIIKEHNIDINVLKYTKERHKTGKITHLLYAVDNGVCLNKCTELMKMYNGFKKLSLGQYYNKLYLASHYYQDYLFDKEIKTLIVGYYYKYKTKFGKFLYDRAHLIYKIIGDSDTKAELLFNRQLYYKFKRKFVLSFEDRQMFYERRRISDIMNLFFPKIDFIEDDEKIIMDVEVFDKLVDKSNIYKNEENNKKKRFKNENNKS